MIQAGPIGVFDSGVGGLTILKELMTTLPGQAFVYFADSGYAPYGSQSRGYILDRSVQVTEFLFKQGAPLVVVACNTATGAAISELRNLYSIPFVGVEPAVKPAAQLSKTGHIGVLATRQTFQGEHFKRTTGMHAQSVEVHVQAGDGLVELIEAGQTDTEEVRSLLKRYLQPLLDQNIDQLVLGCTHYPFLIPIIREILPETVSVHDPAPAVAKQAKAVMQEKGIPMTAGNGLIEIYTTGSVDLLEKMIERHLPGIRYTIQYILHM